MSHKLHLNLVLVVLFVFYYCNVVFCVNYDTDYCSLCHNHTMCTYKGLGYKCGYTSTGGPLTELEKQIIVNTHNRLRALVASGGEGRGDPGPQPPASDMQQLEWDEDLARTAQAWADQCDFGHDACRLDPRFAVGQNVFMSEGGVPWEQAILSWYSEVEFVDNSIVDNFIFDPITGHYAQMVWGNTRFIGCGKRTYPQKPRRYYKRDTRQVESSLEPKHDLNLQGDQFENIRQSRKIDYNNYNNYQKSNKGYPNRNYDFSSYTYKPSVQQSTKTTYQPTKTTYQPTKTTYQPTKTTYQTNKEVVTSSTKSRYSNYDFSSFTQQPKSYNSINYKKDKTIGDTKTTSSNDYSSYTSQTPEPSPQNIYETKVDLYNYNDYSYNYNTQPQENYYQSYVDEEWKRYNKTIQQYYEKYKNSLQNSDDLKKQLQFYKNYLEEMKRLNSPYLSYEQKSQIFYDLQKRHDILEKIHQRLIYHDQKLKDKILRTKKLNPYIPKEYTFSTETPVIAGQVFEYYVCNYGPTGLWPGARMYTKGWNQCQYDGLCKDPLTASYYPGLDRKNDPILALLYEEQKKK